jgi:hypothetical protein
MGHTWRGRRVCHSDKSIHFHVQLARYIFVDISFTRQRAWIVFTIAKFPVRTCLDSVCQYVL